MNNNAQNIYIKMPDNRKLYEFDSQVISQLLDEVSGTIDSFFILEREDDFMQVMEEDKEEWRVEYNVDCIQYESVHSISSKEQVIELMLKFAENDRSYQSEIQWRKMDFSTDKKQVSKGLIKQSGCSLFIIPVLLVFYLFYRAGNF